MENQALTEEGRRLAALLEEKRVSGDKSVLEWSEARDALSAAENMIPDGEFERLLGEAGWTILYTWDGSYVLNAESLPSLIAFLVLIIRPLWNHHDRSHQSMSSVESLMTGTTSTPTSCFLKAKSTFTANLVSCDLPLLKRGTHILKWS